MQAYEFIEGYEQVVARFGQWPSFHDGEVLRIILDRSPRLPDGTSIPSVEIHLRGWIMGPELAEDGRYKLRNDSVIHFLFEGISEFELEGFNQQNVVTSVNLALSDGPHGSNNILHVEFEHCYQFCCAFIARRARVMSIRPYSEPLAGLA
ncbi:Imm50 family immunity protein [Vogesella sp. LIG4]|uniref:Imm50 family immunity protein n=1 Tax=Vogesella sp. LIG4 TaxID=1192162 RepID=UPI0008201F96|nr:Imm50 family immunity protein [Vogesella sp. LIG4]SCK15545.1 Immunity protein 50 [Vogesella sp. LIG4]